MRIYGLALALAGVALMLAQERAQARCADDLAALQTRVDRATKMQPPPPGAAAAAKTLQKFNDSDSQDEVDCYNTLARARRALAAPPPEAPPAAGQAQRPIGVQPMPLQSQMPLNQPQQIQK
jgi:hypothetical protein